MQFKTDKRSVKTRKAIKIAFLKLAKTHDISQINITELTAIANINRNSFYTHYKTVGNILDDINQEILSCIDGLITKNSFNYKTFNPYPIISEFSKIVQNNKYISEYLLFSNSSTDLVRKLKDCIYDKFYNLYLDSTESPDPAMQYIIAYLIAGVFEMYHVWFKNEKSTPIDVVATQISHFVVNGLRTLNLEQVY